MLKKWIPWNYLVKYAARRYNVLDPLTLMARMRRFAQPSEVQEPIELLRAGILFHARGLVNTRAIQHNLDWVWPYWVERQFDPRDSSFIPRAFSFSHINLTHRNWTAVGVPNLPVYPIVDPRGLLTPLYDGWSLDAWLLTSDNRRMFPSQLQDVEQEWSLNPDLEVITRCQQEDLQLSGRVRLSLLDSAPQLNWQLEASGPPGTCLLISLRPYNPEGIQFVESANFDSAHNCLVINEGSKIHFSNPPARKLFANYQQGDVSQRLNDDDRKETISCDVGMATVALAFPIDELSSGTLDVQMDLSEQLDQEHSMSTKRPGRTWSEATAPAAVLEVPDPRIRFLYDAAVRNLILLSADSVVPGPYTYKRFWFRDACLMLNAMLCVGLEERSVRCLETFPQLQKHSGYFLSQEGEWDSNGQVLWIFERYLQLTGRQLPSAWQKSIWKGADWIMRKRLPRQPDLPHAGLLPPGFSAEHFGPNDYYYWDDFWGASGLLAAARLASRIGKTDLASKFAAAAEDFTETIWDSIARIPEHRSKGAIPASPYRRLDAGAIGCLAADYPLQLVPENDSRIQHTAEFLYENCFLEDAFFQDMIHSGINPYLTLTVAQTFLRNDDPRYRKLIQRVADLATPTGQWPEAIHPRTGGGCMGDGQHGWAAAEWVMIIRNLFVREEPGKLILGAGIFPEWLEGTDDLSFGPTLTPWGPVSVRLKNPGTGYLLELQADWRDKPPLIEARVPGYKSVSIQTTGKPYSLVAEDQ